MAEKEIDMIEFCPKQEIPPPMAEPRSNSNNNKTSMISEVTSLIEPLAKMLWVGLVMLSSDPFPVAAIASPTNSMETPFWQKWLLSWGSEAPMFLTVFGALAAVFTSVKSELKSEIKSEIATVKYELKSEIATVKSEVGSVKILVVFGFLILGLINFI
jgi:hypothetical protein